MNETENSTILTLPVPCISESCIEIKIKLNFYFHTSLWCLNFLFVRDWGRERLSIQNIYVSDDYCGVENQLATISLSYFRQVGKRSRNFSCHNLIELRASFGEHSLSTDVTLSENPPFLTTLIRTRTHTYQGIQNVNFR